MPDGLGSVILFMGVVLLMVLLLWRQKSTEGFQEELIQLTRTAIALVATFSIFYGMLHGISVGEGVLTLYGVIITLYFKGEKVLRGNARETKEEIEPEPAPAPETKEEKE